jgi:hypothetical protein
LHLTAQPYLIPGSQFVAALAVVPVALTHDLTVARKMADGSFSLKVTVYLSGALVLAGSMMGRNSDGAPLLIARIPGHGQDRRQHEGGIPLTAGHNCGRNTQMAAGSAAVARTPR